MKGFFIFLFSLYIWTFPIIAQEDRVASYHRLDPKSVREHIIFYSLYPNTEEGALALKHAWHLISPSSDHKTSLTLPQIESLGATIDLITDNSKSGFEALDREHIETIQKVASNLKNRELKGYLAKDENQVLKLDPKEVDLARGLLLNQFKNSDQDHQIIEAYEAAIDFMALQILPYAPLDASPEKKIEEINRFIFDTLEFRFPPHSLWVENIDTYTFLPSVLDSRRGVCLGVSILYLCIAQRLGLDLEIVTPPGHIYIRYPLNDDEHINIETTARGIQIPSEDYLSVNTHALKLRNMKEVIGFARYNQASVYWQRGEHKQAIMAYLEADKYVPNDPLILEYLGYNLILSGKISEGREHLRRSKALALTDIVYRDSLIDDYFHERTDREGISLVYQSVDDTRESILEKQQSLIMKLRKYPKFQMGLFHLAITYLQLGEKKHAMEALEAYHKLNSHNPIVEYYLAEIKLSRFQIPQAWDHFIYAKKALSSKKHFPKPLKELQQRLLYYSKEPLPTTSK